MAQSSHYRIALLQYACSDSPEQNLKKMLDLAQKAASQKAQLIITPELFHSPYFAQSEREDAFDYAIALDDPLLANLAEFCKHQKVALQASIFERLSSAIHFNSSLMFNHKGDLQTHYRKTHLPDDPGFYEKYYFRPGDRGYQVAKLRRGPRTGMLICWDQWFPEAARLTAMKDAELLSYPTAIGHPERDGKMLEPEADVIANQNAWRIMHQSHAISNGLFVAATNRTGLEGELRFWGGSLVIDPLGRVIGEMGEEEGLLLVDLDMALISQSRRSWPFFRDRRSEIYSGLLKSWLG